MLGGFYFRISCHDVGYAEPDNHLLSRTLRARDNGAADDIRCLFGAKRLTTSGSSRLRAEKPAAFPPFAAYPPPR